MYDSYTIVCLIIYYQSSYLRPSKRGQVESAQSLFAGPREQWNIQTRPAQKNVQARTLNGIDYISPPIQH